MLGDKRGLRWTKNMSIFSPRALPKGRWRYDNSLYIKKRLYAIMTQISVKKPIT